MHFSGDPESGSYHQLTHGLFSQHNVMEFGQLLAGERRTKVGIFIANDAQSNFSKARNKLAITAQSMAAVRQCQRSRFAITCIVTVKRHRLAVFIEVVVGGHHVIKGRLTLTET
ncbi:hypothetical protein Y788_14510 [Pantoea dispersa 625]|nr:hypothetical protein Y788_14510 [Pantoea dispersa 625]